MKNLKTNTNSTLHTPHSTLNLPSVSEMMRGAGLEPKKSLGQNFLFDLNLTRKIARSVPDLENSVVLEVGPGPGGLTRALLECGAKKVIAIEKDRAAMPILEQIQAAAGGRLEVVLGDALKIKNYELRIKNYAVCANLPYNVGTELLIRWLHEPRITSMTLMFQREVAERIVAKPGSKQYGRLSVLAALGWRAKILFNVPNTAFVPPPKVQSAVVQLVPLPGNGLVGRVSMKPGGEFHRNSPHQAVEKITAMLFGQRRKMIRSIMPGVDWAAFGLSGTERAEELSPEVFVRIAEVL